MQIVYTASDIVEAHLVAGMLQSAGIEAYVGGHYLQGAIGELSPFGFANVFVEDSRLEEAAGIIKSYESNNQSTTERFNDDFELDA